jgi:hypothetical protein
VLPCFRRRDRRHRLRNNAVVSAMEVLVPALTWELALVRVGATTPGLMNTLLLHTANGVELDTVVQNRAAMLLARHVGTTEEVAQVFLLLMTNAYATGKRCT